MKDTILYGPDGHELVFECKPNERERAFRFLESMQRAAFKSADTTRHNIAWSATCEDINVILQRQLKRLRARSRSLAHNNAYGAGAINTLVNYCIGTGFDLQMTARRLVFDADGNAAFEDREAFNDFIEDLFEEWGEHVTPTSTAAQPEEFWEMQPLAFRRWAEDGEVFIVHYPKRGMDVVPFAFQVIDADMVDTPAVRNDRNGNPILMGVELDKTTFQPVAYWMHTTDVLNPLASDLTLRRVPAEHVIHVFRKRFPFQVRGIPFVATVADKLFQVEQYNDAQLVRNKIAAMFALFIEGMGDEAGDGFSRTGTPDTAGVETVDSSGFPVDAYGNRITNLAPGVIAKVPAGFKVHEVQNTSPEAAYRQFLMGNLQAVGTGYEGGLSYIGLTRDTSETTFAGGRQQENQDFQGFRPLMKHFSRKALSNIFRAWFDTGVLSGAITVPAVDYAANPRRWRRHRWMPSGWDRGINPLQQVNASEKSMANMITTLDDEASLLGYDAKTQIAKAHRIERQKQRLGLPNLLDGTAKAAPGIPDELDPSVEAEMARVAERIHR